MFLLANILQNGIMFLMLLKYVLKFILGLILHYGKKCYCIVPH